MFYLTMIFLDGPLGEYIGSSQAVLVSAQANILCHLHGVTLTLIVLNLFLEMSFMETHDADR